MLRFTDITEPAGLRFRHDSGARGKKYNPETFGPGAGWIDYDVDGHIDLLLLNGTELEAEPEPNVTARLYKNLGNARFEDVTGSAGLSFPFYGMGFTTADLDEDGDPDLLLYGLHGVRLLENENGRFRDRTADSGLDGASGWMGAAAFFDYDLDGHLDLFLGRYVEWSPRHEEGVDCTFGTRAKKYCPVAVFPPQAPLLFRGKGDGRFEDVTELAGIAGLRGKALGVVVEDVDRDRLPDILVANDSVPNFFLRNRGDGTFEDLGLASGFATDGNGAALAGMGIDSTWTDEGRLAVVIGNFSGEPTTFHVEEGGRYFRERSFEIGIGQRSLDRVTFGTLLEDFDLDGIVDFAQVNGHVFEVESITRIPYRQTPQLFGGRAGGTFEEIESDEGGAWLEAPIIGRALATADFDLDGDLDLVLTENAGEIRLLRNDTPPADRTIAITLEGRLSHRDAIGAEAELLFSSPSGERRVRRTVKAVSSYLSQSTRDIVVAWHEDEKLVAIEARWPLGLRERFAPPKARRARLIEGEGAPVDSVAASRERDAVDP
ncbi:MAG TPA: VCBS repeat-containing protein, partial [Planctomycetota bacterium]|nr:VCBS repeat-containing protein [Planctomycetota bacterium]